MLRKSTLAVKCACISINMRKNRVSCLENVLNFLSNLYLLETGMTCFKSIASIRNTDIEFYNIYDVITSFLLFCHFLVNCVYICRKPFKRVSRYEKYFFLVEIKKVCTIK